MNKLTNRFYNITNSIIIECNTLVFCVSNYINKYLFFECDLKNHKLSRVYGCTERESNLNDSVIPKEIKINFAQNVRR